MQDIRDRLAESIADVDWQSLIPHAQRDALIIVNEHLDLLDVGVKVAANDVTSIQAWIAEELLIKPSATQLSDWNQEPDKLFSTIIVQPYVLVKEVSLT